VVGSAALISTTPATMEKIMNKQTSQVITEPSR
jgi:hypothetical protein